jgi:hypothetical protein
MSQHHERYRSDGRPGTWKIGAEANKLDYIILSPTLWERVKAAGVERRGVRGGKKRDLVPAFAENHARGGGRLGPRCNLGGFVDFDLG